MWRFLRSENFFFVFIFLIFAFSVSFMSYNSDKYIPIYKDSNSLCEHNQYFDNDKACNMHILKYHFDERNNMTYKVISKGSK
jgi:hypothetical protein